MSQATGAYDGDSLGSVPCGGRISPVESVVWTHDAPPNVRLTVKHNATGPKSEACYYVCIMT